MIEQKTVPFENKGSKKPKPDIIFNLPIHLKLMGDILKIIGKKHPRATVKNEGTTMEVYL